MYVRDIMTKKVVTVPSSTHIIDAKRLMTENNFRRIPVVDDGKLVGVVTERELERLLPDESQARGMWDFVYNVGMLYRTPVRNVMIKTPITVAPDMTAEEALALAQSKKVGSLIVLDKGKVVGIVTTNDFFYRIVNKVLGIGEPGCRIQITGGGESKALEEIISLINKRGLQIIALHLIAPEGTKKKDIVVHVDCKETDPLEADLKSKGYKVDLRRR